jgi:hypothetical protein
MPRKKFTGEGPAGPPRAQEGEPTRGGRFDADRYAARPIASAVISPLPWAPRSRPGRAGQTSCLCGTANLARAEVDVSKLSGEIIKFGATVTLIEEDTGEKKIWQIVGDPEADVKKGKISVSSPLARTLIGKTRGATVEVEAPGGAKVYRIRRVVWTA